MSRVLTRAFAPARNAKWLAFQRMLTLSLTTLSIAVNTATADLT
jgi:hypothetical protein